MSELQKELVSASGFEPTKNYERQDWLAALARQVNEMPEDEFDNLSVEAQDWFNEAVKALNKKKDVPDFPDAEEAADDDDATEDDAGTDEEDSDPTDDNPEDDSEEVEAPPPKKAAKGKKVAAKPADDEDETPPAPKKTKPVGNKKGSPATNAETNDYGVVVGTKSDQAVKMLEKGCRMSDITEEIGGTYYNLIQRLVKDGHTVEKTGNGMLKLTHKDGKKGKAKK